MAALRAISASAKLPAMLGVGVMLLPSAPFRLMAESRGCTGAADGFRPPAAVVDDDGRFTGGCGGVGLPRAAAAPLTWAAAGGAGGGRGIAAGGGACSST